MADPLRICSSNMDQPNLFIAFSRPSEASNGDGKIRATQTALIYSETLGPGRIVEEASVGLAPGDPTDPVISALSGWNEDTMLVSHLPLVGKLVARLVTGDESRDIVKFHTGTVTCLRHPEGNRGWTLAWALGPDLLGS